MTGMRLVTGALIATGMGYQTKTRDTMVAMAAMAILTEIEMALTTVMKITVAMAATMVIMGVMIATVGTIPPVVMMVIMVTVAMADTEIAPKCRRAIGMV